MGKSTKRKYNKHFEKHQLIPGKNSDQQAGEGFSVYILDWGLQSRAPHLQYNVGTNCYLINDC